MIKGIVVLLMFASVQMAYGQIVAGRFVAFESSYMFSNPKEPRQRYIIEIEDENAPEKSRLFKAVYFIPTNGSRSGVKIISKSDINYEKTWKMEILPPQTDEQKKLCAGIDNYSRDRRGKIYMDDGEPILMFRSTRFSANMIFEKLSEMPCVILRKFEL